jgi:pimeloyl-ACP methyl ester carboxylesterase
VPEPPSPPEKLAEQLSTFRAGHPYTRRNLAGVEWEYIACGRADQALLLLPGGLSTGESLFRHILELEDEFRIIAPSYANVGTMRELSDGLAAILDAEGIAAAHVAGGSYGGLVAQAFAHHHPQRVRSLVLSHTGAPDPKRGQVLSFVLKLFPVFPSSWLRAAFRAKVRKLLQHLELNLSDRQFLESYQQDTLARFTHETLRATYQRAADFFLHYPSHTAMWSGTTLIMESDDDPAVPPADRAELKANYPHAQVHTFHGTGHLAAVLRLKEYNDIQRAFWRGLPPAVQGQPEIGSVRAPA